MNSSEEPQVVAGPWDSDGGFLSRIIATQSDIAAVELDPRIIMQMVSERTQNLTGADGASVQLIDGEYLVCHAVTGIMTPCAGRRLKITSSLSGCALRESAAINCEEAGSDPRADRDLCDRVGIRSKLVVPMFHAGEAVGVLNVVSLRPGAFQPRHVAALRLMGGLVADALHHATEFEIKKKLLAERTGALAALRESEERFRSSFEHAAIGMALVALDGRWTRVNRSICDIVGYSEAELLVTDFQAITHPEDLEADLDNVRRMVRGEIRCYQMTKRYLHKQGHIVWILLSVSLVRDERGQPLYFIAQIQDITERKRAEDALRISEAAYRTTFELAGVGMAQTSLQNGRFMRVNRKLCEITGYSAAELCCKTFYQITHVDDVEQNREAVEGMKNGTANEFATEKRYIRKDGAVIWVNLHATVIRDLNGRPMHCVAMYEDITRRKGAEEALRASERRFRALASQAPVGIFQRDAAGNNVFVNDRWCLMTGLSPAEAAGDGWANALHPDDRERVGLEWEGAIPQGREFSLEYRYRSREGKVTWVHGSAAPLRDEAGRVVAYLGTSTDLTERKQAECLERDRREVLELVTEGRPLPDVLDRLTHLIERQTDGHAVVMLLDGGDFTLFGASLPAEFASAVHDCRVRLAVALSADARETNGGIGVTDITTAGLWNELRTTALSHAIKVCWALPIQSNEGGPLGLLTVYPRAHAYPTDAQAQMLQMVGKLATISIEHHQTSRQMDYLVRHDALTGLPNRILFEDRMQQALAAARRNQKLLAVFAMDLDRFKSVNDTLGHHAGDSILQQFAARIGSALRETDTLARVGGDEFLLLLPELTSSEGAATVAGKIIAAMREPFIHEGTELSMTTSIGIAVSPTDGEDAETLRRAADAAMYLAKRRGRNGFAAAGEASGASQAGLGES